MVPVRIHRIHAVSCEVLLAGMAQQLVNRRGRLGQKLVLPTLGPMLKLASMAVVPALHFL